MLWLQARCQRGANKSWEYSCKNFITEILKLSLTVLVTLFYKKKSIDRSIFQMIQLTDRVTYDDNDVFRHQRNDMNCSVCEVVVSATLTASHAKRCAPEFQLQSADSSASPSNKLAVLSCEISSQYPHSNMTDIYALLTSCCTVHACAK